MQESSSIPGKIKVRVPPEFSPGEHWAVSPILATRIALIAWVLGPIFLHQPSENAQLTGSLQLSAINQ
jgi:hypothetical protein